MPNIAVYDDTGKKTGDRKVADAVWTGPISPDVVHEVVRWQLARRRAGTHATKTRGEIKGTGAKPYKQKGTGRARQGSIKTPHHKGGGRAFGPKPRDYDYQLPKKVRRLGLLSALRQSLQDEAVAIWKNSPLEKPATPLCLAVKDDLIA